MSSGRDEYLEKFSEKPLNYHKMQQKFQIFIPKPQHYMSWQAFYELAEVIKYGLEDLGHECLIRHFIEPTRRNIIIGCHLLNENSMHEVPKNTIIINTESLEFDMDKWNDRIIKWCNNFETWDYSEKNLKYLPHAKHLDIGYHSRMRRVVNNERETFLDKDIDVLFYGGITQRRATIINGLMDAGLTVETLFGVFGSIRDSYIARSKVVLNMHRGDSTDFEMVRCFYLMTNAKAIVAESDKQIDGIHCVNYDNLVESCVSLVNDDKARYKLEQSAINAIYGRPQNKILERLLCDA